MDMYHEKMIELLCHAEVWPETASHEAGYSLWWYRHQLRQSLYGSIEEVLPEVPGWGEEEFYT